MTGFVAGGYALVLPPGWVRVPVAGDLDRSLDEAIERALPGSVPRDERVKRRVEIKGRLLAEAERAREAGGLDLYLPLAGMHGLAIPASFLVSEVPVAADQDPEAAARAFLGAGAEAIDIDGSAGLRLDDTLRADRLMTGAAVPSRRITYLLPTPGLPRWLVVSFGTVGDGDPASEFTEILVGLFDAIMTTFRWAEPGDSPPAPSGWTDAGMSRRPGKR